MAYYNDKIKELRKINHLTLKDVAKKLGVTEATAQRYESGKGIKDIPYENLLKLADLFGVTPSTIMGWERDENTDTVMKTYLDTAKGHALIKINEYAENMDEDQLTRLMEYAEFLMTRERT